MSDLVLEDQNTAERQTELIATNADLGPDELKKFPDGVILQVKPGAQTAGSFDGINGIAGGAGRGVVGQGAGEGAGVAGFSRAGDGINGTSDAVGKSGVFGFNSQNTDIAFGVFGRCDSPAGAGVSGRNDNGDAVNGFSVNGNAVKGRSEKNDLISKMLQLSRHTSRDCRYPNYMDVMFTSLSWWLGSGNPCRNDEFLG